MVIQTARAVRAMISGCTKGIRASLTVFDGTRMMPAGTGGDVRQYGWYKGVTDDVWRSVRAVMAVGTGWMLGSTDSDVSQYISIRASLTVFDGTGGDVGRYGRDVGQYGQ